LRAVIFAHGNLDPRTPVREILNASDLIIAADGGARHCIDLGLTPSVVIGDFDSLEPEDLSGLEDNGSEVIRFPVQKDFTDLELALTLALERGADDILIFGGIGSRLDQSAANLLLLGSPATARASVQLMDGMQTARVLHTGETLTLQGKPGDTLSLIPLTDTAAGVTTNGLEYFLKDEALHFGSTRGVSNTFTETQAEIHLETGLVLVVVIHGPLDTLEDHR
jgi:thiamine pyrophosphokinase